MQGVVEKLNEGKIRGCNLKCVRLHLDSELEIWGVGYLMRPDIGKTKILLSIGVIWGVKFKWGFGKKLG